MEALEANSIGECKVCYQLYFPGEEVVERTELGRNDLAHLRCVGRQETLAILVFNE